MHTRSRFAKVNAGAIVLAVVLLVAAAGYYYWNSTSESREVDEWKKSGENLPPVQKVEPKADKSGAVVEISG